MILDEGYVNTVYVIAQYLCEKDQATPARVLELSNPLLDWLAAADNYMDLDRRRQSLRHAHQTRLLSTDNGHKGDADAFLGEARVFYDSFMTACQRTDEVERIRT